MIDLGGRGWLRTLVGQGLFVVLYTTMRAVKTVFGSDRPGPRDGRTGEFFEPGGLSVTEERIYIREGRANSPRPASA